MLRLFAAAVTLIAFLATFPVFSGPAYADEMKMDRMISRTIAMTGHGEVRAVPDVAQISFGVTSYDKTARAALTTNTKAMQDLITALTSSAIDKKDMSTSNFNVGPRYVNTSNDGSTPAQVGGYDVTNTITVNVRKVDSLGEILDKAVSAGSNQIYGISFSVSDADKKIDQARKDALADAKRKAELYAAAGGFTLGQVVSVSEGGGMGPQPMVMARAAKADMAADVPLANGEQTLGIDVSAVWEIK
jgi:uncharacterized protein